MSGSISYAAVGEGQSRQFLVSNCGSNCTLVIEVASSPTADRSLQLDSAVMRNDQPEASDRQGKSWRSNSSHICHSDCHFAASSLLRPPGLLQQLPLHHFWWQCQVQSFQVVLGQILQEDLWLLQRLLCRQISPRLLLQLEGPRFLHYQPLGGLLCLLQDLWTLLLGIHCLR